MVRGAMVRLLFSVPGIGLAELAGVSVMVKFLLLLAEFFPEDTTP